MLMKVKVKCKKKSLREAVRVGGSVSIRLLKKVKVKQLRKVLERQ